MKALSACQPGAQLNAAVAERIVHAGVPLAVLESMTGIHRAKLGRMRTGKCNVTIDEAQRVLTALNAS